MFTSYSLAVDLAKKIKHYYMQIDALHSAPLANRIALT